MGSGGSDLHFCRSLRVPFPFLSLSFILFCDAEEHQGTTVEGKKRVGASRRESETQCSFIKKYDSRDDALRKALEYKYI